MSSKSFLMDKLRIASHCEWSDWGRHGKSSRL